MKDHPIPSVSEPLQYRAIGLFKGVYTPDDSEHFTRGHLTDKDGSEISAVVLGRVLSLMNKHLEMNTPHLWIVYPRSRESNSLHLQIAGIWEPSTLKSTANIKKDNSLLLSDDLPEGDNYFSIRGELIYTRPEKHSLVLKIRPKAKKNGKRARAFKLPIQGNIPVEHLRKFVSLDVRREAQQLHVDEYEIISSMKSQSVQNKSFTLKTIKKGD